MGNAEGQTGGQMSDRRHWFKHFSTAHDDPLISNLLSTKPEAVAYYWVLLELISWYGTAGRLSAKDSFIRGKLKINLPTFWRLLAHFQDRISAQRDTKDPTIIQLFCPKFVELQGSWGGKRRSRSEQDPLSCPGEDRSKKKDTPIVPYGDDQPLVQKSKPSGGRKSKVADPGTLAALEAIYQEYPRKKGKKNGMKSLAKQVAEAGDRDLITLLNLAVKNYVAEIKREGTAPEFIKHFSSFANCWEDFLPDPEQLAKAEESRKQRLAYLRSIGAIAD